MAADFLARLRSGPPLLLDSAMGSELERRGAETGLPLWSARALTEAPEMVAAIHRENVEAGADVLTANTFRTQRRTVGAGAADLTRTAVRLAREAAASASRPVFVAGSIAPLEDCYRPDLVPPDEAVEREHREHADNLAAAGADLLLIETMNSARELRAAAAAAAAAGLPFVASVVTDGRGLLLSGEPVEGAVRAALPLRPAAAGVNCVDPAAIGREVERIAAAAPGLPIAAYANVLSAGESPEEYARSVLAWIASGARIVGGCCGTTPAHTAALRAAIDALGS